MELYIYVGEVLGEEGLPRGKGGGSTWRGRGKVDSMQERGS